VYFICSVAEPRYLLLDKVSWLYYHTLLLVDVVEVDRTVKFAKTVNFVRLFGKR
jgi:hypothetical protein